MKRVITEPQRSDMGDGFGLYEFDKPTILEEFLKLYNNSKTWGKFYIFDNHKLVAELKFDGMTINKNGRYQPLQWDNKLLYKTIKEIKFNYCFMCEDVEIYLGD